MAKPSGLSVNERLAQLADALLIASATTRQIAAAARAQQQQMSALLVEVRRLQDAVRAPAPPPAVEPQIDMFSGRDDH